MLHRTAHPRTLSRRSLGRLALVAGGLTAAGTSAAALAPAARAAGDRQIVSWGSSSLAPQSILNGVKDALGFTEAVHYARGGQTSLETLAMRGGLDPELQFPDGVLPAGTEQIEVEASNISPGGSRLSYGGWIDEVGGRIEGTDRGTFLFHRYDAGDAVEVVDPGFRSEPQAYTREAGHHVLWMGKNDLGGGMGTAVPIENTQRAWDVDGAGEDGRVLVLGYWRTELDDLDRGLEIDAVNTAYAERFGADRFLDAQELLTSDWGLTSPPVQGLGLQPQIRPDGGAVPPAELIREDGMHLTVEGEQIVSWAITEKMREFWAA